VNVGATKKSIKQKINQTKNQSNKNQSNKKINQTKKQKSQISNSFNHDQKNSHSCRNSA
jgi:cell shape-determining protein MreC